MSELFLIAHKVRGKLAFDIAEQLEVEGFDEPWWIVSTSGHRAYPFWFYSLNSIMHFLGHDYPGEMPEHLLDHTDCRDRNPRKLTTINLEELDL